MHYLHVNDLFHSGWIKSVHETLWQNKVTGTEKCLNYKLYKKDFNFENYFNILPLPVAKYICKFRCSSHELPVETGRFLHIERNERICHICNKNELGDEFHSLFNCEYFSRSRLQLLPVWSFHSPNSVKCEQLMTSTDRTSTFCKDNSN